MNPSPQVEHRGVHRKMRALLATNTRLAARVIARTFGGPEAARKVVVIELQHGVENAADC
jgi:hypothetical protein